MKKVFSLSIFLIVLSYFTTGYAQPSATTGGVLVDENGILRWEQTGEEIKGFGVNYTVPFAHAFRSAKKLGIDPLEAIDKDVYHFARLGFDLYRVHVWDTEISDTLGNLLYNENLHAFDYLLKKLGERGINYVITPIAFWGNGWPEPDESTPGFSAKYGKGHCLTNPEAIKAQENYLFQFMNHINPYTGFAYKNDPRLIAMEISNEPHHRGEPEKVTEFIKGMVNAVRKTGYKKPIFYNVSHSVHLAENYFAAGIQGGTFQWYPTGLGYQQELKGNFLPNVDHYNITFDQTIKEHKGAKLVYEFDAADIGKSYIYPAMARSFRTAGIQIATHFSYDPTYLAYANTEYNTHHMNLAYTPSKALSLKICSEIFHRIPINQDYGSYPANTSFDGFFINYEKDLAMLNVDEKYFYTNNTSTPPVNESRLNQIAGHGSSPVVEYSGSGAYFLDKLDPGVWRLEVMPDALIVDNPYGRNSLEKTVAVIQWNERNIYLKLKDLGPDFSIKPLNEGNKYNSEAKGGKFNIQPGSYLLVKSGVQSRWKGSDRWGNIKISEFQAPQTSVSRTYLVHKKPETLIEGSDYILRIKAIAKGKIKSVRAFVSSDWRGNWIDLEETAAFEYQATVHGEQIKKGILSYYIVIETATETTTYPAGNNGLPFDWDFYDRNPYQIRVIEREQPIYLFDAASDWEGLSTGYWSRDSRLVPLDHPHESEYQIHLEKLHQIDNENLNGPVIEDYCARYYLNDKLNPIRLNLSDKEKLVVRARSLSDSPTPIQIALVTKNAVSFGTIVELNPGMKEYEIDLSSLQRVKMVTMPRPYPTFLPYYFSGGEDNGFKLEDVEGIQINIGPGMNEEQLKGPFKIGLTSIYLK